MKKIKVLQHVYAMDRAGAETLIMNLYRNIDKSIFEFDFLVHKKEPGDFDNEIRTLGGNIIYMPPANESGIRKYKANLEEVLKRNGKYDVIHTHVKYFSGISLSVAKKCSIPVRVAHSHLNADYKEDSIARKIYRNYMKQLIKTSATKKLACSRAAGEMLFSNNKFELFSNAIDLNKFKFDNKTLYIKDLFPELKDKKIICHIGRFVDAKNHDFILKVFKELCREHEDEYALILLGDGDKKDFYKKQYIKEFKDNEIYFLGVREDIPEILSSVDAFFFPSKIEGLPVVLVEAQAAGVPCVISNNIPLEVDMEIGLVERLNLDENIDRWINAIKSATLKNKLSFENRKNGLIRKGYDLEENIKKIQEIYKGE